MSFGACWVFTLALTEPGVVHLLPTRARRSPTKAHWGRAHICVGTGWRRRIHRSIRTWYSGFHIYEQRRASRFICELDIQNHLGHPLRRLGKDAGSDAPPTPAAPFGRGLSLNFSLDTRTSTQRGKLHSRVYMDRPEGRQTISSRKPS